jgi:hypothetical protein
MGRIGQPLTLFFAIACAAHAQAPANGTTVTMQARIDSGGTTKPVEMSMRRQTAGNRSRMETTPTSGAAPAAGAEGVVVIFRGDDSTMITITPSQRTAMIMAQSMVTSFAPSFTENLTGHTVEDLGPGEPILGHATRHYRVTTTGTFEISMMGEKCSAPLNATSEHWIAPDVDLGLTDTLGSGSPFGSGVNPIGKMKRTGVPSTMPKGGVLRSIAKSQRKGPDGSQLTVTSTTQVTELVQGPLDSSVFAPPADYRVMDMRQMMANLPPGAMEAANGQQAKMLVANMCKAAGGS